MSLDDAGIVSLDDLVDRLKYLSGEPRAYVERGIADFVAEVLVRKYGGTWDAHAGVLAIPGKSSLNVGGWAAKRLHYGRQDSLVSKVGVAAELVHPTPEPDWDPDWPQDREAADELAAALLLEDAEKRGIDASLTKWLALRKSTYMNRTPGLLPVDEELTQIRTGLVREPGSEGAAAYALARRHKAHAWVQHWRFGRALSGPSSFLVSHDEKPGNELEPAHFLALSRYLASAPQYREDSLLEMLWRVEKASRFRAIATPEQRRMGSMDLLRLVADAHAWTATKHVKRFLGFIDSDDEEIVLRTRDVQSEWWPGYWAVLRRILFPESSDDPRSDLRVGYPALVWLDGSDGIQAFALVDVAA